MSDSDTPSQDIPEEPVLEETAEPVAVDQKRRGWFARAYDPETRGGSRLRSITRVLALIVGMYALGLLTVYLLLYRPAEQERKAAWTEVTRAAQEILAQEREVTRAAGSLAAAEVRSEQAQTTLDVEQARVYLLRAMNEVTRARLALFMDDTAAAEAALTEAEKHLTGLQPPLQVLTEEQLDTLAALFTLAKNDLERDPTLATQDLDRLQSELELAEKGLEE